MTRRVRRPKKLPLFSGTISGRVHPLWRHDCETVLVFLMVNWSKTIIFKCFLDSYFSIQGRTYPVQIFYAESPVPEYLKASVETVIKIHESQPEGDVLLFLTGQEQVETVCK